MMVVLIGEKNERKRRVKQKEAKSRELHEQKTL